jgi:hypothetical protein
LELFDAWTVPALGNATVDVLAGLPNLRELSLRSTDVSDDCVDKILAMPKLQSLTLKENSGVTAAGLAKLKNKKWSKLDVGNQE